MENEKYINYYIETLIGTMNDAVVRNVSLQANARVSNEVIEEQAKKLVEYEQYVENLKTETEEYVDGETGKLNEQIQNHLNNVTSLNLEVNRLKSELAAIENVKHQAQHVDTFRNELLKERNEHEKTRNDYENRINGILSNYEAQVAELKDRIDYLQLTPAKRKKIDEAKANTAPVIMAPVIDTLLDSNPIEKDGGSF
jgi:chromosome segregation ATPase